MEDLDPDVTHTIGIRGCEVCNFEIYQNMSDIGGWLTYALVRGVTQL